MNSVAIIGGTGLYDIQGLESVREHSIDTPFGSTSSSITSGVLSGVQMYFLARHGLGHSLLPHEINYRANIWALKKLGCAWCISVSAVGSLREHLKPGDIVIPDQVIDRTKNRQSTFFGEGLSAHVTFADPVCSVLSRILEESAKEACHQFRSGHPKVHVGGTYICMEGPAFSTRAESNLYRSWGADIIGMTNLPEAKLAREAEMSYATLALVTDYDCWRSHDADVDVTDILAVLKKNSALSRQVIEMSAASLAKAQCPEEIARVLDNAILSDPLQLSAERLTQLEPILAGYLARTKRA